MGDRGHWTTELIRCRACAQTLYGYFVRPTNEGAWTARVLGRLPWNGGATYWCLAGLVQGAYAGEEVHIFEGQVTEDLEAELCHTVTFWVFAEAHEAPQPVTVTPQPIEQTYG